MSSLSCEVLPFADPREAGSLAGISDDECFALLASAVERHDAEQLDQVVRLIGRLVVAIE